MASWAMLRSILYGARHLEQQHINQWRHVRFDILSARNITMLYYFCTPSLHSNTSTSTHGSPHISVVHRLCAILAIGTTAWWRSTKQGWRWFYKNIIMYCQSINSLQSGSSNAKFNWQLHMQLSFIRSTPSHARLYSCMAILLTLGQFLITSLHWWKLGLVASALPKRWCAESIFRFLR